jgi:predicted nucleic-acid-binding protein
LDALVFTVPDGAPKAASGVAMGAGHDTTSYKSLLIGVINSLLKNKAVVLEPAENVFHSAIPQSHRKGEKAFHVKAHKGSKEGTTVMLSTRGRVL